MADKYFYRIALDANTTKMVSVSKSATVQELYNEVARLAGVSANEFRLLEGGNTLQEDKLISFYGIPNNNTITLVHGAHGGSNSQESGKLERVPGCIELTKEACCVYYDDNPATTRAKMPCGCAISVEAVQDMYESDSKERKSRFNCPSCNEKWEFYLVRHVLKASMSSEEIGAASEVVGKNFLQNPSEDIHKCLKCGSFMTRDYSKKWYGNRNRVVCNICTKKKGSDFEFCWLCGEEWRGWNSCGNASCEKAINDRIKILQTCGTKQIGQVSGCPNTRACPECGMLIQHIEKCKHVDCKCGCSFCFVCLKPQKPKGQWQCGSYNTVCAVAPRQNALH